MVAQLIRGLIPDPWIGRIDFSTLRPARMCRRGKWPPVLSIVLYNGARKWRASPNLSDHIRRAPVGLLRKLCITLVGRAQCHLGCSVRRYGAVHSGAYGLPHSTKRCAQMACAPRGCGPIGLSLCCAPWHRSDGYDLRRAPRERDDWVRNATSPELCRASLKVTPEHRFVLIDVRLQNPQHLDKLNNTVGLLLQFEQPHPYEASVQRLVRLKQMHLTQHALRRDIGTWVLEVTGNDRLLQALVNEFVNPKGTIMNMDRAYKDWVRRMKAQGVSQGISQGLSQGLSQGISQGRADLLSKLLTEKFGTVPPKFKRRLQSASIEELDQWGINILTAQTPEEVFGNAPSAPQLTPRKTGASQATA